jgi:hypothetical protein
MIDRYIEENYLWEQDCEELDEELQCRILAEDNCDCYLYVNSILECPLCSGSEIYEFCKKTKQLVKA